MAGAREGYDKVMPTLPSIMKYMHMCEHWVRVVHLQERMQVNESTPERMCRRLYRHGLLDRRQVSIGKGVAYEYRSSKQGRWLFRAVMDGRIEVEISPRELSSYLDGGAEVA